MRRAGLLTTVLAVALAMVGLATAEPLRVGDRAPDFRLPATTGGVVSLGDHRGRNLVLIEFYHSDWGPNCTANLSQRRDDHDLFTALGVVILAISIDHTYSQAAFARSLGLPYPLLSDYPDGSTVLAFGVEDREGQVERVFARPSFFLVDRDGIIRGYWGQRPANPDEVLPPDPLVSSRPMLEMARALAQ